MKNLIFLLPVVFICVSIGCSKELDVVAIPVIDTDTLTSICKRWELNRYTIKTDETHYHFTGNDISRHALRTLTFYEDRNFTAGNGGWSGTFQFSEDSTQIVLRPADPYLIPITLTIDHLSPQQIQCSSPQVNINPENPNATGYERFVAFQGLSWLYNRNIDTSNLKTIKIQFTYYGVKEG